MKILVSSGLLPKERKKKKNKRINVSDNSMIFYIVSFAISLTVVILMVTAFYNISVRATSVNDFSDYTVIIDAGHGGEDGGAVVGDVCEKDINLTISLKLNELFKANGINTKMTRTADVSLSDTTLKTVRQRKTNDIKKRCEILNESSKNILISIHQNKFEEEQYYGTQVFYSVKNSKSKLLAESIKEAVVASLQPENKRETKPTDNNIYLLSHTDNIAVLIECGFLSNKKECQNLQNEEYQEKLCLSILEGLKSFTQTATA